jgi:hypothetical protein
MLYDHQKAKKSKKKKKSEEHVGPETSYFELHPLEVYAWHVLRDSQARNFLADT